MKHARKNKPRKKSNAIRKRQNIAKTKRIAKQKMAVVAQNIAKHKIITSHKQVQLALNQIYDLDALRENEPEKPIIVGEKTGVKLNFGA